jgi:hypothetical protein
VVSLARTLFTNLTIWRDVTPLCAAARQQKGSSPTVMRLRSGKVVSPPPDSVAVSADLDAPTRAILTTKEASNYLWDRWRIQRSERRLAQLRALPIGTGPAFMRDGVVARYRRDSLDAWAEQQLGHVFGSTSDESAWRQASSKPSTKPPTPIQKARRGYPAGQ